MNFESNRNKNTADNNIYFEQVLALGKPKLEYLTETENAILEKSGFKINASKHFAVIHRIKKKSVVYTSAKYKVIRSIDYFVKTKE